MAISKEFSSYFEPKAGFQGRVTSPEGVDNTPLYEDEEPIIKASPKATTDSFKSLFKLAANESYQFRRAVAETYKGGGGWHGDAALDPDRGKVTTTPPVPPVEPTPVIQNRRKDDPNKKMEGVGSQEEEVFSENPLDTLKRGGGQYR